MHSKDSQTNQNKVDNKWWIKWWVRETLYGSFMLAPLDELGFFLKLCCLSKQGNYEGYIKATDTEPITHLGVAGLMGMGGNMNEFERLLQIQKDKGRVIEDEKGIITITKFYYFQNEKGKPRLSKDKLRDIIENKKANKKSIKSVVQGTTRALNELNGAIKDLKQKENINAK
jgi:hypothetical protein